MHFDEFMDFIKRADDKLSSIYGLREKEIEAYAKLAKINEEMGELSAEVLKHFGKQHESKLKNVTKQDLENEFADVIITVTLLAKTLDVDIKQSIINKIQKIEKKLGI